MTLCDHTGAARWNYIWERNPIIVRPVTPLPPYNKPYILTGKGHLPYLDYPASTKTNWKFSQTWRAKDFRGRIYLTAEELEYGAAIQYEYGPFLLIEPPSLRRHENRRGPTRLWEILASTKKRIPYPLVQLQHQHANLIPGVRAIPHQNFRQACAILQAAELAIMVEGGLAHAAAALAVPSVVLWGGMISAEALGYPEQVNLVDPDPRTPCGSLGVCPHCAEAWARISAETILKAVDRLMATAGVQ